METSAASATTTTVTTATVTTATVTTATVNTAIYTTAKYTSEKKYLLQQPPQQHQIQYIVRLYLVTDETYPALSKDRRCSFKISLNGEPQTIFINRGAAEGLVGGGGAAQGLVGGDDQLLGSVTLECGDNITAPTLEIQTIMY